MNNKKLLVCHGEGIGNTIQIAPLLRTLKEIFGYELDYWHTFGSYVIAKGLFPYVNNTFLSQEINKANISAYSGVVSTFWARDFIKHLPLKLLAPIYPLSMERSEVDTYMQIARDLGVVEEDIIWEACCNYGTSEEGMYEYEKWKNLKTKFDIVISNGYNRKSKIWAVKGYDHYEKVVDILKEKGYSVCSVGSKEEYIKGTVDMTGLKLLDTLGVIKNSMLLLSNDSGLYHCANALQTNTVVLFTATSIAKNYDKRFHKYTTILGRDDLKCRPCQAGRRWLKDCKEWLCQDIDPQLIVSTIETLI